MREPPEELGRPMRSCRTVPGNSRSRAPGVLDAFECATPRELVVHDKAGELILERSLEELRRALPEGARIVVYKNNSDGKELYGTHENYLVDWATPFAATSAT